MYLREKVKGKLSRELFLEIEVDGTVRDITSNCDNILGYTKEEMVGNNIKGIFRNKKSIEILDKDFKIKEFIVKDKESREMYMSIEKNVIKKNEKEIIYLSMLDITPYKTQINNFKKLTYLSYHDSLTGIHNRNYFEKQKEELNIEDKSIGLIICDLDNLKFINDVFGHEVGDESIKRAAKIIQESVDGNGIVSRIGGDEYVVILENIEYKEVEIAVENIRETIKDYNLRNPQVLIQMSIGFEYSHKSMGRIEEIFRNADKNMYKEKQNKKLYKNYSFLFR